MCGSKKSSLLLFQKWKKGMDESGQQLDSHTEENYKSYHIESKPKQLPHSGRWSPYVSIDGSNGAREQLRRFGLSAALEPKKTLRMQG
jgi:hypothetical protein